jgi:uncharacterized protein (DUF305 family)
MKSTFKLATVLAAAALTLAACITIDRSDSDGDDSSSSASKHNDADVEFAQNMIPHHAQAIVMSSMARKQAKDPELRRLAADIQAAQEPEIEQMSGWLKAWDEDVPRGMDGMGDGDHDMGDMGDMMDDGDMPGMMTGRQMMKLGESSGFTFDRMWLQMMIEHHEGAIEMAKTEQRDGLSIDAIELAESIESSQTAEIATMTSMLRS